MPFGLFACKRTAEETEKTTSKLREPLKAVYRVDCGGGAVTPFTADQYFSGGDKYSTGNTIVTSGVGNAAPAAVYQSERFGNHSYTFPSLTPNADYTVRLHFAEIFFTTAGARRFNVLVNGVPALTNLDIFAAAGANTALVRDVAAKATNSGQIVVQYVSVKGDAKSNGIEIFSSIDGKNQPPIVSVPAAAEPNPSAGLTSTLTVLGADDGPEGALTYTWTKTGSSPGTVTFSANGNNTAKKSTATFSQPGTYALEIAIKDKGGLSTTSKVSVIVGARPLTPVARIDCGGGATDGFSADRFFKGGSVHSTTKTIVTAGVRDAAPAGVYQSQRYGNFSYTFDSLVAKSPYTVRLHFAETFWTAGGSRSFNVLINGAPALTNFDIFAAGGANNAVVRDHSTTATDDGKILIEYVTVRDNAEASGIEILSAGAPEAAPGGGAPAASGSGAPGAPPTP